MGKESFLEVYRQYTYSTLTITSLAVQFAQLQEKTTKSLFLDFYDITVQVLCIIVYAEYVFYVLCIQT